jgi:hypothetical protein
MQSNKHKRPPDHEHAQIRATERVSEQSTIQTNRDSFTIHPSLWLWQLLKKPQQQPTGLSNSSTRWMDGMEQTICLQQRNKPKNLLRGGEEKASKLALLKCPATEKRLHLSASGVQDEGEER